MSTDRLATQDELRQLYDSLRREPDTIHVEPISGERMWLKQVRPEDFDEEYREELTKVYPGGYITDCCYEELPCEYHKKISEESK